MTVSTRFGMAMLLGAVLLVTGCLHPARGVDPVPHPEPLDPKGYPREEYPPDYPLGDEPRIETGRGPHTQGEAFEDHTVPCQTVCKVFCEPDEGEKYFARAGFGVFLPEIGEGWVPAWTAALGRRLGNNRWFVEVQTTVPRQNRDRYEGGQELDDWGRIWFHTVNVGREYFFFDDKDFRIRSHIGLGYFRSNSLGDNDDGLCTTAGVAAQYKFWDNFSAELGVAHYGMVSDIDRDNTTYRHNFFADLSLVFDF